MQVVLVNFLKARSPLQHLYLVNLMCWKWKWHGWLIENGLDLIIAMSKRTKIGEEAVKEQCRYTYGGQDVVQHGLPYLYARHSPFLTCEKEGTVLQKRSKAQPI